MLGLIAGTSAGLVASRVGSLSQKPLQCLIADAPPELAGLFDPIVTRTLPYRGGA